MTRCWFFVCFAVCLVGWSSAANYDGYKTIKIRATSESQMQELINKRNEPGISFLKEPSIATKEADVMVSPDAEANFLNFLDAQNINYEVVVGNVGQVVEKERKAQLRAGFNRLRSDDTPQFDRFLRYDEFCNYVHSLAQKYPDICQVEVIGQSYEGRDVVMLKISSDARQRKPIFFIESGMHAREWAGPMTVTYFMYQLVENFTSNQEALSDIDWYIVPVANPDGYEYTHTHDRMWRKSRQPYSGDCVGGDPNRNFNYHWAESGSSYDECSEIYHGGSAFSEVEARNIANTGKKYADRIGIHTAVHAYGSYFLYPWGYGPDLPSDWRKLQSCAEDANDAISRVYGTSYSIGTSARLLYNAAGGSDDYMKGVLNITYAYTVELPGTDDEGFVLPPQKILPVGIETFEGFKVMAKCPSRGYSSRRSNTKRNG